MNLIKNPSVLRRSLKENENLPVDICVVILCVVEVLCRDANKSAIAMANSKLAVSKPNIKPCTQGGIDKQYCRNIDKHFNL